MMHSDNLTECVSKRTKNCSNVAVDHKGKH